MRSTLLRAASILVGLGSALTLPLLAAGPAAAAGCTGQHFHASYDNQTLKGTCGDDTFDVYPYVGVKIYGDAGNDKLTVGFVGGTTYAWMGNGNDTVSAAGNARVVAYGEAGDDTMRGGQGDDFLDGGTGADALDGRWGTDTLIGGDDNDTLTARSGLPEKDYLNGGTGKDTAFIDEGLDVAIDIETFK